MMAQAGADAADKVSVSFFFIYQALLHVNHSYSLNQAVIKAAISKLYPVAKQKMLTVCE